MRDSLAYADGGYRWNREAAVEANVGSLSSEELC